MSQSTLEKENGRNGLNDTRIDAPEAPKIQHEQNAKRDRLFAQRDDYYIDGKTRNVSQM